jgi:hypothetical protein
MPVYSGGPESARQERLVDRCLAIDPRDRWQSAGDLAYALRDLASPPGGVVPAADHDLAPSAIDDSLPSGDQTGQEFGTSSFVSAVKAETSAADSAKVRMLIEAVEELGVR